MKRHKQLSERFKELGFKPESGKIALIDLAIALEPKEGVYQAIDASFRTTVGLLVATETRVVYAGASFIKESVIEKIPYEAITEIDFSHSPIPSGDITITHHGRKTIIAACSPEDAQRFIIKAKEIIANNQRSPELGKAV